MKNIIVLLFACILFSSCHKNYHLTIYDVDFYPISDTNNTYIKTPFLDTSIVLYADIRISPPYCEFGVRPDDIIRENSIIDSTKSIICDKDLYLETDTLKANTNIIKYFTESKYDHDFNLNFIYYGNKKWKKLQGYYKFKFSADLSNKKSISDSCIVKLKF